ncbi:MAG TPA: hypothetical protein V6C97_07090 [Oculatellaceae cyanobacterium]
MSLETEQGNSLVGGPVLVAETQIYDLAAARKRREGSRETDTFVNGRCEESQQCADGVCVLAWRPRRPRGDVA